MSGKRPASRTASSLSDVVENINYGIDDTPPWYLSLFFGFQQYLTMLVSTIGVPLILAPALCIQDNEEVMSKLLGTIMFVSGLITLVQATVGCRLPVVQGASMAFFAPVFAIMALPQWQCPSKVTSLNTTAPTNDSSDDEIWMSRMREIQGAIIMSSLFQVVIGLSGAMGLMMQYIGPLVIVPTISLIGLSLVETAADYGGTMWWIAFMTVFIIALFSQYLRNIDIPIYYYRKGKGWIKTKFPLFKLFSILLGISLAWFICLILTVTDAIPNDPTHKAYPARTDVKMAAIMESPWFRFPYPGQWGMPTFSTAGVLGMLAAVLAGIIESIGDYYSCARLCGAPPPPTHAVNRGILVEGFGHFLSGWYGGGVGTATYSGNIGAIGITKVGSRQVILIAAVLMMVLGCVEKIAGVFVSIPEPIIGGLFIVIFGMITAVGLCNLQYINLNSSRNLFILGLTHIMGLTLPHYLAKNKDAIQTGSEVADQIFTVLGSTSMFVGGFLAFILDNTIPGTNAERGLIEWKALICQTDGVCHNSARAPSTYDIPYVTSWLGKIQWTRFIPFCPAFTGFSSLRKNKNPECGMRDSAQESRNVTSSLTSYSVFQVDANHTGSADTLDTVVSETAGNSQISAVRL